MSVEFRLNVDCPLSVSSNLAYISQISRKSQQSLSALWRTTGLRPHYRTSRSKGMGRYRKAHVSVPKHDGIAYMTVLDIATQYRTSRSKRVGR
eukprot:3170587-Rhodomonas_salina.6